MACDTGDWTWETVHRIAPTSGPETASREERERRDVIDSFSVPCLFHLSMQSLLAGFLLLVVCYCVSISPSDRELRLRCFTCSVRNI